MIGRKDILPITGNSIRENGIPGKEAGFEILAPSGTYRFFIRDPNDSGSI